MTSRLRPEKWGIDLSHFTAFRENVMRWLSRRDRFREMPAALVAAVLATAGARADGQTVPNGLTFLGEPVTAEEIAQGQDLYAANCASCHGADLEG
ncbi:MAG: c-type cytochrome, partial [Pseudomonadota bacterium]